MGKKDIEVQQQANAKKLAAAVEWLRSKKIYRGDTNCQHRFVPPEADPGSLRAKAVEVSVRPQIYN